MNTVSQAEIIAGLPAHLRRFACAQDYSRYSPRDQAVWRYLMHKLAARLRFSAHPVYLEGLRKTGISLEHIPSIDEMNAALHHVGWRALVVDGFIPPAIFMEFQSLKILVIALEMRSIEHVLYTPAPDIVHESAGHAPFIVDIDYAEFLQRFGEVGMKAISTAYDYAVYEAIRHLSIVKESASSRPEDIAEAESALSALLAQDQTPSEATLLSRLHWWTVEYGLVGEIDDYRIFGAGLLSSLGEGSACLDDERVRKLPLTVDAIATPYDITRPQPQLFVTKSCRHLSQVLEEFAAGMCMTRGGAQSLQIAIDSAAICTAQYNSGIQVSGQFCRVLTDAVGNEIYLATTGPTQLAYAERELPGHGSRYHAQGFGSPVGKLKDLPRCLSKYSVDDLRDHGIDIGQTVTLEFLSGITVRGQLEQILRQDHKNLLMSFNDCRVTDRAGRALFEPNWGTYDMAVGARVESVFGGAADREKLDLYAEAASNPAATADKGHSQNRLCDVYAAVRRLREAGQPSVAQLEGLAGAVATAGADEWLLQLELLELAELADANTLARELRSRLRDLQRCRPELAQLIEYGLELPPLGGR